MGAAKPALAVNIAPSIVSIGEVLWDLLPSGPVLGGAPANLACHAAGLGGRATLVSCVGDDDLGRRAMDAIRERGVDVSAVGIDPRSPTGTVNVTLDAEGNPQFDIRREVAWDRIDASPAAMSAVRRADAVCFGTLAQRDRTSRDSIQTLVRLARPQTVRLLDINLRPPYCAPEILEASLELASALKLNETELPVLARQFGLGDGIEETVAALAARFGLDPVILTLGAEGSRILHRGAWTVVPGRRVDRIADTVGAGDAYTAAFLIGMLRGRSTEEAARLATEVAAFVCTQHGATPEIPEPLRQAALG